MNVKETNDKFLEMVELGRRAGANIFQRVALAIEILADREWVRAKEFGGGDESTAIDRMESAAFGEIASAMSLPELIELRLNVPEFSVWEKHKFKLRKIHDEWKERTRPKPKASNRDGRATGTPTTALPPLPQPRSEREDEHAALRRTVAEFRNRLNLVEAENRQLQAENRALVSENHKLKKALERVQKASKLFGGDE